MKAVEALEHAELVLEKHAANQYSDQVDYEDALAAKAEIGKLREILADPGLWRTLRRSETRAARRLLALLRDGGTR